MTTTPHTQGKLRVGAINTTLVSDDANGPGVRGHDHPSYGGFMVAESVHPENARRLAACWNACEGFTTEQLENILMLGDTLRTRFEARNAEDAALSAERDTLLQHLQACVTGWQKGDDVAGPMHSAMALLTHHHAITTRIRADIARGARQSNGKLPG